MSLLGTPSLTDLAIAARSDVDPLALQSALLASCAVGDDNKEDYAILYCWLAFNQLDFRAFDRALIPLRENNPTRLEIRALTLLGWLWRNDLHSVAAAPSSLWSGIEQSLLLQLCKADFSLKVGNLLEAENILSRFNECICPEMAMLQASLLSKKGHEQAAIELLLSHLHRCSWNIRYYRQLIRHMIDGKDAKNVMACAHEALSKFGENPEILHHFTTLNLYKRQPGLAKRSALLQQVSASIRPTSINLGNQLATYEMNGQADWLGFLSARVTTSASFLAEPLLQANLAMQFASIQSEKYRSHLDSLLGSSQKESSFLKISKSQKAFLRKKCNRRTASRLKIGWMTGDCNYHPVSRFLYGWLATCFGELQYQHVIISLEDHREESYCDLFRSVPGIDVHDVSCLQGVDRLRAIRDCNYDIVVDLSGWIGGNFIAGLNARLSPFRSIIWGILHHQV